MLNFILGIILGTILGVSTVLGLKYYKFNNNLD